MNRGCNHGFPVILSGSAGQDNIISLQGGQLFLCLEKQVNG